MKTKYAYRHGAIKKALSLIAGFLLLFMVLAGTAASYRTLKEGMSGEDVKQLKLRMYELGYFTSDNVSEAYNSLMARRVSWLQQRNGLEETGIATPQLQELIYSADAVPSEDVPVTPAPTPVPLPVIYVQSEQDLPLAAQNGLLPAGTPNAYVYRNPDEGTYIYLSTDMFVIITHHSDPELTLQWCETEIMLQNGEKLNTYLTPKGGRSYRFAKPEELAAENHAVLAFTDDFFNYRLYNKQIPGIIIRNGQIISDKTYATRDGWPPLDTLAVFDDGSMKTFAKNQYTAQEYLDMGAEQVFAFGPILVQNGEMGERIQDPDYYHYREPRCALGMIEPYHYIVLTVSGRTDESRGAYFTWLAQRMLDLDVQEALNLDGGGTTALVFMGESIYAECTGKTVVRDISSLIGVGRYMENGQ